MVPRCFPRTRFTDAEWKAKSVSERTTVEHDQKRRNRAYLRYFEANFEIENADLNDYWKAVILRENIPFCVPENLIVKSKWYHHMVDDERKEVRDTYKAKADALIAEGKLPDELCTTILRRIYWEKRLARHRGVPYENEIDHENALIDSYVADENEEKLGFWAPAGDLQQYHVNKAKAQSRFRAVDHDIERLKGLDSYWITELLRERVPLCVPESNYTLESWRSERRDVQLRNEYVRYYKAAMSEVKAGRLPENLCTTEERRQFWRRMVDDYCKEPRGRLESETSGEPEEIFLSDEDEAKAPSSSEEPSRTR